jgi:hypothetical protein
MRHRLELQGDVGHDPDHGEDGDDRAKHRRLAITAGDEVGDADDVVFLADADHLAQQKPPAEGDEGGPEIDGEKVETAGGGPADAAVIGPGGGVDRQGK